MPKRKKTEAEIEIVTGRDKEKADPSPRSIVVSAGMAGRFGKAEVESTAGKLVLFFKDRGEWGPFKLTELADFYRSKGWDPNTMLTGLAGAWYDDSFLFGGYQTAPPYIVFGWDGNCCVTRQFIDQLILRK